MGPDEQPSREELGLIFRFMFAKFEQQGEIIGALTELLVSKGIVSDSEIAGLADRASKSEKTALANEALKKLRDFAAIHSTARRYLDRLEE